MPRKRHTPEQIITKLREAEVGLSPYPPVWYLNVDGGINYLTGRYPEHSRNFHARLHRNYTSRLLTANLPSGQDTRESDEARFVQGKLR